MRNAPGWRELFNSAVERFAYNPTQIQLSIIRVICASYARRVFSVIEAANGCGKTTCIAAAASAIASQGGRVAVFCSTYLQISRLLSELSKCGGVPAEGGGVCVLGGRGGLCSSDNLVSPREICSVRRLRPLCRFDNPTLSLPSIPSSLSPPAASPGDSPAFSSVDELVAICRERRVCAYELEWGVGARARLVAAPQAYLLSPHAWAKIGRYVSGAFAVVDECHNLASAARPGFSVEAPHVSRAGRYVAAALSRRKRWGSAALRRAFPQPDWVLSRLETEIEETAGSDPGKAHALVKEYEDLQALLNSECDALVVRGDHYEVFRGFSVEEVGSRMSCFSSAAMLSATPGDATYYQSLASDSPLYYERCDNPYTDGSLKVYIATDFTTRFVERSPLDAGQVASRILRITRLRPGLKIGAYFPSYEYMRAVAGALSEAAQSFSVNRGQRRWVEASVEEASVMLDVQGGSGSEGFDPPFGLDVSVAVGLALRHPGASRRTDAYDYAETDVAWAVQKAVQSVGRVVRGPSDSGVGVLMDKRFCSRAATEQMPRWFRECVAGAMGFEELVAALKTEVAGAG